jgi:pimeloyl-ACP methyl ester carboxylesterase
MKSLWLNNEKAFLRYVDTESDGEEALVLLHGLGTSSIADFSETIADRRFAAYRCLLIDFLGFGFSDRPEGFGYSLYNHAETVAALLDSLQIKTATVAGHSMGGTVAIALAQKRPDLVSRLIVMEPNLNPGVGSISKVIASQSEREFVETGYEKFVMALRMSSHRNPSDSIYLATFSIADPIAIHRSAVGLLEGTSPPQRELLAGLGIPKAYITGEQNVAEIPFEQLHILGMTTHIVLKAGHSMMHENPLGFRETLLDAIKSE